MNSYLVFDTEFSIKQYYNRVGNWLYNPLVAIGLKSSNVVRPYSKWIYPDKIKEFIVDEDVLVGHNIKTDLLYVWGLESLQEAFMRGLRIWDTSVAHYMLSGQREKYPALRDIAVRCYGLQERDKLMEFYWNQGIDTMDIPQEIVLNDVENDVLDTEAIYLQQVEEAKKKGMYELIQAHAGDTLCGIIECEYNGMKIDREILGKNRQELEKELEESNIQLSTLIGKYWK